MFHCGEIRPSLCPSNSFHQDTKKIFYRKEKSSKQKVQLFFVSDTGIDEKSPQQNSKTNLTWVFNHSAYLFWLEFSLKAECCIKWLTARRSAVCGFVFWDVVIFPVWTVNIWSEQFCSVFPGHHCVLVSHIFPSCWRKITSQAYHSFKSLCAGADKPVIFCFSSAWVKGFHTKTIALGFSEYTIYANTVS